tara:strand:- start:169 stop:663 length:495 start_codon:yes stop_codon:yes gene_type:complete
MTKKVRGPLAGIADLLRKDLRSRTTRDPVKQSLLDKGFDTAKMKRQTKRVGKYNYPTRLQQINDARAEAARSKRLSNPQVKEINEETIKIAEERVKEKRKEIFRRAELSKYHSRPVKSYRPYESNPYSITEEDNSIEVTPAYDDRPRTFKNKVEEHIWKLKNKK